MYHTISDIMHTDSICVKCFAVFHIYYFTCVGDDNESFFFKLFLVFDILLAWGSSICKSAQTE